VPQNVVTANSDQLSVIYLFIYLPMLSEAL